MFQVFPDEKEVGGREEDVMSVLWTPKSTGRKGKCSLAATINPNRRKREEGGKGGVRIVMTHPAMQFLN